MAQQNGLGSVTSKKIKIAYNCVVSKINIYALAFTSVTVVTLDLLRNMVWREAGEDNGIYFTLPFRLVSKFSLAAIYGWGAKPQPPLARRL